MRASVIFLSIADHVGRLRADERGAVSVIMGVLMVPLVGALAIGFEVSNWYMTMRGMQNAADAATIAAATNGGSNYDVEAKAVAARYGYVDGTNTISITASNSAACPGGGNNCYSVTISSLVPLLLSRVLGFKGNATSNGAAAMQLSSSAVAKSQPQNLCMLALAGSGAAQGIRTNGAPVANMNGCNVMSNTAAQCNGSNLGAGYGFAHGTSNNCGATPVSNVPAVRDPYAYLASNIPPLSSSPCAGNYPQETTHGNTVTPPSARVLGAATLNGVTSSLSLNGGNNFMCGDQVLTANVTINTQLGSPAVLVIENGQLDLNGHTLTTSNGSAVTIVFSGTNGSYVHAPTDNTNGSGGNLNIAAPTSGPWSGVAIYQDPSLTTGVDVSGAGNSPTWNISGLVYMPHASVTFKGAIDKATNGKSCFVMVADNFQISGTAGIAKTDIGQCGQAGLKMPTATASGSIALVQ
jgi:Putative Flp pilus-assembly TadE/G-like